MICCLSYEPLRQMEEVESTLDGITGGGKEAVLHIVCLGKPGAALFFYILQGSAHVFNFYFASSGGLRVKR